MKKKIAVCLSALVLAAAATVPIRKWMHRPEPLPRNHVEEVLARVPGAAEALHFRGAGFPSTGPRGQSDPSAAPEGTREQTLEVKLPAVASAPIQVGRPGRPSVAVTIEGRAAALELEHGRGVYASVAPGVDAIAVRDPEHFELAFVVQEPEREPPLKLRVQAATTGGRLGLEPGSGALLVKTSDGRTLMKADPPLALDAAGTQREGRYELNGDQVTIALAWSDLKPPVLVDPKFYIPFWTLLSDERTPGFLTYSAPRASREAHAVFDEARGKVVVVRPVRSQQPEDTSAWFAKLSQFGVRAVAGEPRSAPDNQVSAGAAERRDWARTWDTESETWTWDGTHWALEPATGLTGFIDPGLTYDPTRQRLFVATGGYSRFDCLPAVAGVGGFCSAENENANFSKDVGNWLRQQLPGPPDPRVRAALAPMPPHVVLFGGRALLTDPANTTSVGPWGRREPPFPETFAAQLLNDTWRYDGTRWERLPTANPPPAREGASLVYDERRRVLVLIGGFQATLEPGGTADSFDIWEFDGVDWIERIRAGDGELPVSLQTRRGMMAVWNPIRQTTLLVGGIASRLSSCSLTDREVTALKKIPERVDGLMRAGCLDSYLHDSWEWDGRALRQLTDVAYAGPMRGFAVFRQIEGTGWSGPAPGAPAPPRSAGTPLLPWRYDADPDHFRLRSMLDRAHAPGGSGEPKVSAPAEAAVTMGSAPPANPVFVSPLFASEARPEIAFDRERGVVTIFGPEDGRVLETNGVSWSDRTPTDTPFSTGQEDFFAAAWDSVGQRILLFDPRTARTWSHSDSTGWAQLAPPASPPIWNVDPEVRRKRDVGKDPLSGIEPFASVAKRQPQMVFDRARSRAVMIYGQSLWEFDGVSWTSHAWPTGWTSCPAAVALAYSGTRSRTVAVGCKVPAQTMEWNGTSWSGPFLGPFEDGFVTRNAGTDPLDARLWYGTLQTNWVHPNAFFETAALGGVSIVDGTGTLRTWNGSSWGAGPQLPERHHSDWSKVFGDSTEPYWRNVNRWTPSAPSHRIGRPQVPLAFFPPGLEDAALGRLILFRDGVTGMRQMSLDAPAAERVWKPVPSARVTNLPVKVHPHPFELLPAEQVLVATMSNPATRYAYGNGPQNLATVEESIDNNLYWPFRLLPDPITKRIRVLTHRGAIWELGVEFRKALGEPCQDTLDCGEGYCTTEKVCCNIARCGDVNCETCQGTGICRSAEAGTPEPLGRCGSGECAGVCPGPSIPVALGGTTETHHSMACTYDGTRACGSSTTCENGQLTSAGHCSANSAACVTGGAGSTAACPNGMGCESGTSCATQCSSRTDCQSPFTECNAAGTACVPDSIAVAAASLGVTPVNWEAPLRRTPEEIADLLEEAGYERDNEGRILFTNMEMGGVLRVFDPGLRTPLMGFQACLQRIQACMVVNGTLDACVAATPRCVTPTPWEDDAAGADCCPEQCLSDYFEARASESPHASLRNLIQGNCYPGLGQSEEELGTP